MTWQTSLFSLFGEGRQPYFLALDDLVVFYYQLMTLITAHRILISTAIVFFFGFGLWELNNYLDTGDLWSSIRGLLYLSVSAGFALYLKFLKRW